MKKRHVIRIYLSFTRIFIASTFSHGPKIASQRAINFILSGRIKSAFKLAYRESDSGVGGSTASFKDEFPDILLVTHTWNTSGVPLLSLHLREYFHGKGLVASIWSEGQPSHNGHQISGWGNPETIQLHFGSFPKIIFLNTTCIKTSFFKFFLEQLDEGKIEHLIVYSHEDILVLKSEVVKLLEQADPSSCRIFAGSHKTSQTLQKAFQKKIINAVPYQICETEKIQKIFEVSPEIEFSKLRILLVGSTQDLRKAHVKVVKVIAWANRFKRVWKIISHKNKYREIELTIVGANTSLKSDQITRKILKLARFQKNIYPILEENDYLNVLFQTNAVICLSQYETLPLYVSESMARGCVVLRNECGGSLEQLIQNRNGILLKNINSLNGYKIFKLAGRSEEDLKEMSKKSRELFLATHSEAWDQAFSYLFDRY